MQRESRHGVTEVWLTKVHNAHAFVLESAGGIENALERWLVGDG